VEILRISAEYYGFMTFVDFSGKWVYNRDIILVRRMGEIIMKKGLISTIALGAVVLSIAGAGNAYAFKQQYRGDNGMWIQENNTRWWYQYDNGSYARNTWVKDGGNWYYFYNDGWMAANAWIATGNGWFYVDRSGAMLRNTTTPDGYYVNDRGAWVDPSKSRH
jgi:cell wall binding repeat family protein